MERLAQNKTVHLKMIHIEKDIKNICRYRVGFVILMAVCAAAILTVSIVVAEHSASPVVLKQGKTLEELFGYAPEYNPNLPGFDSQNRPYMRSREEDWHITSFIDTLRNGKWEHRPFENFVRAAYPDFERFDHAGYCDTHIIFDANDKAYTFLGIKLQNGDTKKLLMFSSDYCKTFTIYELPYDKVTYEYYVGHNKLEGPPFLLGIKRRANFPDDYPEKYNRWGAAYYYLYAFQPEIVNGKLVMPEPVLISEDCLGYAGEHAGGPLYSVTRDSKTHIVWTEAAHPQKDEPGKPAGTTLTYVATCYHDTKTAGGKKLLAYTESCDSVADIHNMPGICIDSEGILHVVAGAHVRAFKYCRSLKPNDAYSGWTEPIELAPTGQTYVALMCDKQDTLHLAFRRTGEDDRYHDGESYCSLSYQRKKKGQPWESPRVLFVPAYDGYSIQHHKLALDNLDRLFLSLNCWSEKRNPQTRRLYDRMVLMSADGGDSWDFATTRDFVEGIEGMKVGIQK